MGKRKATKNQTHQPLSKPIKKKKTSSMIDPEMIKKWNEVLSLQDTLRAILSFIPDYLLERTMRLVNRDFNTAYTYVISEFKTSLKIGSCTFEDAEVGADNWRQFKNLKSIDIAFDIDDCLDFFDFSSFTHLGVETFKSGVATAIFSKPLAGTMWAQTLRYLEIDLHMKYFYLLFDLNLHTLVVTFQELEDIHLEIGKEEKPLFKSLTSLTYLSGAFDNMEQFLNRLVNLKTLVNDDDEFNTKIKLPNIKQYGCSHGLKEIGKSFPNIEWFKYTSIISVSTFVQDITLKNLKTLTVNLETDSCDLLPNAIFNLPLLEKLSLSIQFSRSISSTKSITPKPLHNLKKLKMILFSYDGGELPITIRHFTKCENIEIIRFLDDSQRTAMDLNDFTNFTKLKHLSIRSESVSDWNTPICSLEVLSINVKKSFVTLMGLDKLKELEFISQNVDGLIQYLNHCHRDGIRELKIPGNFIFKYTSFPSNLEKLTISEVKIKEIDEHLIGIFKKQTNLCKLVFDESKIDILPLLQALTCLMHQIKKIEIHGESYTPYSESKYIKNLLKVLSEFNSNRIRVELEGFNHTFSHQATSYLISQIEAHFTTITFF